MTRWRRLPRLARLGAGVIVAALLAVGTLGVVAPVVIRGRRFGRVVEALLPAVRGQIQVGGGSWSWSALLALARGESAPVAIDDVRVVDPEGTEVLFVRHLTARVTLQRRPWRVRVTDAAVVEGRWRFARLRAGGDVGFLAALRGKAAKPRAGGSSADTQPPASFSLVGARLEGVETTFDLADWGLRLRDVHAAGGLDVGAGGFTFAVSGAEVRGGGDLRIGALAPVAFSAARLDRVATTRDAPDALRLEASAVAAGRSRFDLASTFDGIYGVSRASARPTIDADVHVRAPGDLLAAFAAGHTGWRAEGEGGTVAVRLAGPFQALTVGAEVRGLDLVNGGLRACGVRFDLTAEPSAGRFRARGMSLGSPAGGRVDGEVTVEGPRVDGDLTFAQLATAPFVPEVLRPFAAGTLDGRVRGRVDLRASTFGLDVAALVLHRSGGEGPREVGLAAGTARRPSAHARGPTVQLSGLRVAGGAVELPRLSLSAWGAQFVARGHVQLWDPSRATWMEAPLVSLDIEASRLALERVTGLGLAHGTLSFSAQLRGAPNALSLGLRFPEGTRVSVLDEPFSLPRRATLRLTGTGVALETLRLGGPRGSELRSTGRIAFAGPLALDVAIDRFPLDRLPGLARTELPISGLVSGQVHLGGMAGAPAVKGQVSLDAVTFQGRRVGGGTVTITPGPGGAIRARGHLIDAIAVDGTLVPKREGLLVEATVTLEHLRMDPFLPELPGGLTASAVLSGRLTARVAPGQPVTAEGRLSELALLMTPPGELDRRTGSLELHAEGGIPLAARAGAGPISIGPARFVGSVGSFELWGENRGEAARGTVRGRLQLGPFAPLLARWTRRLSGSVDVDLAAGLDAPHARLATRGTIAVAEPVGFRLANTPVDGSITAGVVKLAGDALETAGLAVTIHADHVPVPSVDRIDGRMRLFARVTPDAMGRAEVAARVAVDALDLFVRELGVTPVRASAGTIAIRRRGGGSLEITDVDLPLRGELRHFELSPVFIERGRFEARAVGAPARGLRFAGTVTLDAARIRTGRLRSVAGTNAASATTAALRDRVLERLSLDLRLRAPAGAVVVEIPRMPDLRVGLDMHVGGTAAHPALSGEPHGSNLYSRLALALWRLFR